MIVRNNLAIPYPRRREGKRGGFYLFIILFYLTSLKIRKREENFPARPISAKNPAKSLLFLWGWEYEKQLTNIKTEKK